MEDVAKTALQCSLKIRQGRKWKNRRCVLSKRSPIADQLTLSFYKDDDRITKEVRRERIIITDKNFCGIDSGHHYHGNSYITTVVCVDQIIALSFYCSSTQLQWYHRIKHSLKSLIEYKCRVVIPNRGKLPAGPAMLYFFDNHFAITSEVPIRLHGSWYLEDLQCYGTIAGGLLFEAKHKKRGFKYVLMTNQANDLKSHFDAAFNTWLPNRWSHLSSTLSICDDHFTRHRSATNNSAYSHGAQDSNNHRNNDGHDGTGASSSYYQTSGVSQEEGMGSGSIHEPVSSTCSSSSGTPVKSSSQNGNTISALHHTGHLFNGKECSQESGIDMHILPVVAQDAKVDETAGLPYKERLYEVMASFKNLRHVTTSNSNMSQTVHVFPSKNDSVHHNMYVNMDDLPEDERIARLNDKRYLQEKDAELLERVKRECKSPELERNSKLITPKYQGLQTNDQTQKTDSLNVQYVKSSEVPSHLQEHVDTYILIPGIIPQTGAASLPAIEPPPLGPKPNKNKCDIKPELGPKPAAIRPPELGPKPIPGPKPGHGPKPELGPKPEYCAFPEVFSKDSTLPELGPKPEYGALLEIGPNSDYNKFPELGPKPRSEFMQKSESVSRVVQEEIPEIGPKPVNQWNDEVPESKTSDNSKDNNIDNCESNVCIPAPFEHDNLTIPTTAILLSQTVQSDTHEIIQDKEAPNLNVAKISKSKKQKHSSPKSKSKRNIMRGRSGSLKSKPESYDKPIYRNRSASVMAFQFDQFDGGSSSSSLPSPTEPSTNFEFLPHKPSVDLNALIEVDSSEIKTESEIGNIPEEMPLLTQVPVPPLPPKSTNSLKSRKAPPRPAKPIKHGNPFMAADVQPAIPPRKRCQTEPSYAMSSSDGFLLMDPSSKGDDGYALMKPAYLDKIQNASDTTYHSPSLSPLKSTLDATLPGSIKTTGSFSHKFSFNVVPNSPIHTSVDVETTISSKPQLKRSATMTGSSLVSTRMQRTYSLHGDHQHAHENIRRGSVPVLKPDEMSSANKVKVEKRRMSSFRPRTDGEYHAIDKKKFEKIKNGFSTENPIRETSSNGKRENVKTIEKVNQLSTDKVEKSSNVSENNMNNISSITCSTGSSNNSNNTELNDVDCDMESNKQSLTYGQSGANHIEDNTIIAESQFSLLNCIDSTDNKSSLQGSIDKVFEKYSSYKVKLVDSESREMASQGEKTDIDEMESTFIN
ncbi:uncharacterized protein [Antedon mediterranea]|uniref:uncharacterized protein n=1 Tax=Antedon mediterranea TaxID=105859 RepID=UPI003AF836C2